MSNNNKSDILFQDDDVCILKPTSNRGILVIHATNNKATTVCEDGLYSKNELMIRKPELGLTKSDSMFPFHSDIIYFRAPYSSDTTNFSTLYPNFYFIEDQYYVFIRIDPEQTYVYNQEGRVYSTYEKYKKSRISMNDYFKIITENKKIIAKYPEVLYGNTISFEKKKLNSNRGKFLNTFEIYLPTERMGEILVKIPHIPKEWFYYCGKGKINQSQLDNRIFGFPPNSEILNGGKRFYKTNKNKNNRKIKYKRTRIHKKI